MSRSCNAFRLGLALLLAGCASGERVELAAYDFLEAAVDDLYGPRYGFDTGVHTFGEGWVAPDGEGMWSLGEEGGRIHLHALGRKAELTLLVSTTPPLAQTGQVATVLVNGHELTRTMLRDQWRVETIAIDIPDDVLVQGVNEVRLMASHLLTDIEHDFPDDRPLGVYLRGLYLTAQLNAEQTQQWKDLTSVPPPPSTLGMMTLPDVDEPPPDAATLPDVLVIVLDAARADRFGCYGYPRDTTPRIDALAASGIRLEQVVSDASYTRCATASLLTGHSWRQHGVVGKDDALSSEAFTWAEILKAAGYQTLGISDNANVSMGSGMGQGFDQFVEVWKEDRDGPETAGRLFAERAAGLGPGPAFAYVHLLPPHTPYFPGEYDLWKPEGYAGNVRGSFRSVEDFDRREIPYPGPDYDRLVSLYDGGLRRVDALAGDIFDTWQRLRRERETLLVITSDHGEAFGEHGRFGHNFTVYDEMLRVPAILFPASAFEHLRASAGELRGLTDILPLVLHRTGVRLPGGTSWPRRFLAVFEDPTLGSEAVFARTTGRMLGLRTPESLTVFELWSQHEFFDLREDPKATNNLRLARAVDYLSGVRSLRAFLESTDSAWAAAGASMSEEDIENLKALGYL